MALLAQGAEKNSGGEKGKRAKLCGKHPPAPTYRKVGNQQSHADKLKHQINRQKKPNNTKDYIHFIHGFSFPPPCAAGRSGQGRRLASMPDDNLHLPSSCCRRGDPCICAALRLEWPLLLPPAKHPNQCVSWFILPDLQDCFVD